MYNLICKSYFLEIFKDFSFVLFILFVITSGFFINELFLLKVVVFFLY